MSVGSRQAGTRLSVAAFSRLWADRSLTVAQIAAAIGVASEQAVAARAKKRGLPDRNDMKGASRRKIDVAEFKAMWAFGVSTREIAAHFGISVAGVKIAVARYDLPRRMGRSGCRPQLTVADYRTAVAVARMADVAKAEQLASTALWQRAA